MKRIAIIHSRVKSRIFGETAMQWHLLTGTMKKSGPDIKAEEIERREALFLIRENGLVVTYSTDDGDIYDTPQQDFKAMFPNGVSADTMGKLRRMGL